MAKKIKNERCLLQKECGRSCGFCGDELGCDYYKNNAVGDALIPDQEELRARLEAERARLEEERLLGELADEGEDGRSRIVYLPVSDLHPHPDNPRRELGDLSELAESIRSKGVMQNLTVVARAEGGYTIIIGHRRHGAASLAGLSELPCVIVEMDAREQLGVMLLENIQRSDLTAYEQARGFQMMFDLGVGVEEISKKTGFSATTVRRRLEMAKLDEKKLKEVSGRQLSFGDFEELAKIKDLGKRNEVLSYIGTNNFTSKLEDALREERVAEAMGPFLDKMVELGAKELADEERWSGKYEQIASVRMTEEGAIDKLLVPKKYQGEPLFYNVRTYWGDLEIYRKKPKEKKEKKSASEREKRIAECEKGLRDLSAAAKALRERFIHTIVMHSKNREAVLMGAAQVLAEGVSSYQYTKNSREVLEFIGEEVSNEYGRNTERFRQLLTEDPKVILPAVIYLSFENDGRLRYWTEVYGGFPKFQKNDRLDALYAWLSSLGYEMSDEELALQNGTHELFAMEEKK